MYLNPALHHRPAPQPGFFARLFGWAQKASAVGPLIARLVVGRPVWPERDYAKLAREGYQQNAVVNAAVRMIAESVASIPWVMYQGKGDKRKEVEAHPFLDLMNTIGPNLEQDWQSLIAALISNYKLTGNLYCERTNETNLTRMELYALRPDRMTIIPAEDGTPDAYRYTVGGGYRDFDIDLDRAKRPLLHLKTFNPLNDWYGQSPLDACAWAIDLHNGFSSHALGTLQNDGAPSGALTFTGTLDDDAHDTILSRLRGEARGYGQKGARMLLQGSTEGDVAKSPWDWLPMGMDAEKMQALDSKNQAAREIAFTLGVPPMLLGIPGDNTYSNYQEARQAFYQDTVIPLARMLVRTFQHWFAKPLGKDVYLELNTDDLDALAEVRAKQWERISKDEDLTVNERRDAKGYEPVEGGDELYVSAGKIPVNMQLDVAETDQAAREQAAKEPKKKPPPAKGGPLFRSPPVVHEPSR